MRVINTWGNSSKHAHKYIIKMRLGKLTVYDMVIDTKAKHYQLTFLNFTLRF